jgi:hypothetical protein
VNDAVLMRVFEGIRELGTPSLHGLRVETVRRDPVCQLSAWHQLHHDERLAIAFADVVDGADVRVTQLRDCPGLTHQAIA